MVKKKKGCAHHVVMVLTRLSTSPITAQNDKFKAHSYYWTVPEGTAPGSYAFDFVELVQLRRSQMTVSETVKVNIVD